MQAIIGPGVKDYNPRPRAEGDIRWLRSVPSRAGFDPHPRAGQGATVVAS